MYRRLLVCQALVVSLCSLAATPLRAQTREAASGEAPVRAQPLLAARSGVHAAIQQASILASKHATPPIVYDFPDAPEERLARAERAFRDGEYPILRPLLKPTLVPTSQYSRAELTHSARILLAVGLYFEAQ